MTNQKSGVANDKLFILGVGCQKGGTTWLRAQLAKHPSINMGFVKEYHIFDALYLEDCKHHLEKKLDRLNLLIARNELVPIKEKKHAYLLKLIDFYRDTKNYFDYFDYLFCKSQSTIAVGDITPSYACLPTEAFEHIKSQAEERGFKVKVIFLMRDPVERIWSLIRMRRRNKLEREQEKNPRFALKYNEQDQLLKNFQSKNVAPKTRYENTISNLDSVFNSNDIYYGFYETLFSEESIEKIEDFLGIRSLDCNLERRYNAAPKTGIDLNPDVYRKIADYFRDTYTVCNSRFDTSRIWKGYDYL